MDREHTMRVDGRVVTCTCGYSVAFPDNVERAVAAAVARKHLASVHAPLTKPVQDPKKKAAE